MLILENHLRNVQINNSSGVKVQYLPPNCECQNQVAEHVNIAVMYKYLKIVPRCTYLKFVSGMSTLNEYLPG